MALQSFTKRVTAYETWGTVELDPGLRRAVVWSGVTTVVTLLVLLNLRTMWLWSSSDFFLLLRPQLQWLLGVCWNLQRPLIILNLTTLGVYICLLIVTQKLQASRLVWLRVAYVEAVIGAVNGFILLLCSAVIVVNVVTWLIIIAMIIAALPAMLAALANN